MGNDLHREHKVIPHSLHKLHTIKWNQLKRQNKRKRKSKHSLQYLDEYGSVRIVHSKYWNHDTISAISSVAHTLLSSNTLSRPELTQIVVNGIPFDHRHSLWKQLIHFDEVRDEHPDPDGYYHHLLEISAVSKCRGHSTISIDIPRTFPNHNFFKLQTTKSALFNVLCAFSVHEPDIGYVQGLNYIVALLLFHYNEQDTFWMLCALIRKFHLRSYYLDEMESLQKSSRDLGQSIEHRFPKLSRRLHKAGVLPIAYTAPYFLTLFTYNCPMAIVARFWDLLMCSEILFDSRVSVEQLIADFVLLYIELKHSRWKKTAAEKLMAQLRTIEVEEYEMTIIIQHVIDSHPFQQHEDRTERLLFHTQIVPLVESSKREIDEKRKPEILEEKRSVEDETVLETLGDGADINVHPVRSKVVDEVHMESINQPHSIDSKRYGLAHAATNIGRKIAFSSKSAQSCTLF